MLNRIFHSPLIHSVSRKQQIQHVRHLNLHEYQSMEIMKEYGIQIPEGVPAMTPDEADKAYMKIVGNKCRFSFTD